MFKLTNHHQSSISRLIGAVLSGHKSIQYAELDFFDGLTLIVGKNNSGKTNLLEFLYQSICFEYLPENTVLVDLHFQTTKQEMCKWRITHQVKQLNLSHNFQHRFQTQEQLLTNNKIAYEKNTTGKITDKSKISRAVPIFNRSQINNQVSYMPATTSLD
ncbi:MAG: AAA family ATPase, partial [Chitinophagales bacterium]